MNVTGHELGFEGLDRLAEVDSLCLFIAQDERPLRGAAGYVDWRLCGGLSRVLIQGLFTGAADDCLLLPSDGRLPMIRVFAVGLGPSRGLHADGLGKALAAAAKMLSKAKVEAVALEVPGAATLDDQTRASALKANFLREFTGRHVAVLGEKSFAKLW